MATIKNAIVGNRMQGLVGVDSWSSSGIVNLTKEPAKSVTVRRVIKVGENNHVLEEMANSSDRLRDSIRPYALGVNPMVSVQFQTSKSNASLPYKLSSAFRPPIIRQEESLPLSRLHRKPVEITLNSVISNTTEPFFFHKPLKQTIAIDSNQLPSAPKSSKSVYFDNYKLRKQEYPTLETRERIQTGRIVFENPRVVVVESLIKPDVNVQKTFKTASVPTDSEAIVLDKNVVHSSVQTPKSFNLMLEPVQPQKIRLNDQVKLPEYTTNKNLQSVDNFNRDNHP